jgi:hypothetical protein
MTAMLNESATEAFAGLSRALRAAGFDAGFGTPTVESREALGEGADLSAAIALLDLDPAVTSAALHAYFVFADQAGRRPKPCVSCSSTIHIKGLHGMGAQSASERDLESGTVCGCYCQRRKS